MGAMHTDAGPNWAIEVLFMSSVECISGSSSTEDGEHARLAPLAQYHNAFATLSLCLSRGPLSRQCLASAHMYTCRRPEKCSTSVTRPAAAAATEKERERG